jgi:hypothetical protein
VSGLSEQQLTVARTLFALPEAEEYVLAGGSALALLGLIDRPTLDLDAFVAARPATPPGDVEPLAASLQSRLERDGWSVTVVRRHATFHRLVLTKPGERVEIDLAVDSPPLYPVETVGDIPVLAPQDLAGRKILAIIDRAEGRDYVDLWSLTKRFDRTDIIEWAQRLDAGVGTDQVADALGQIERLDDADLPCSTEVADEIRHYMADWATELRARPED